MTSMQNTTPHYRSSIHFIAHKKEGYYLRLLYMGYWIRNENHHEIGQVLCIRAPSGELRYQHHTTLKEPKSYIIDLSNLPIEKGDSVELEFYSTRDQLTDTPQVYLNVYNRDICVLKSYYDLENTSRGLLPFTTYGENETFFTAEEEISSVLIFNGQGVLEKKVTFDHPSRLFSSKDLDVEEGEWALDAETNSHLLASTNHYSYPLEISTAGNFILKPLLMDQPDPTLWILNPGEASTMIDVFFIRTKDSRSIERPVILPPKGFLALHLQDDPELENFFNREPGWVVMQVENGQVNVYSFNDHLRDELTND